MLNKYPIDWKLACPCAIMRYERTDTVALQDLIKIEYNYPKGYKKAI